ncbi:Bud site selection protein 6 [Coemansia sp. RSA 988]|nr:Bud site selection protein 6 [Coemansia sp. RSA 988]
MDRPQANYQTSGGRSPEPLEYTAPSFSANVRNTAQTRTKYNYNGYANAGGLTGSLRSTRSTGTNAFPRGETSNTTRAPQGSLRRHAPFTQEGNSNRQTYDNGGNGHVYATSTSPPPQQQQHAHLQPFVPDANERRTPDYYLGNTHTIDYNYHRGSQQQQQQQVNMPPAGPVVTSFPEEYIKSPSARKFRAGDYEDGGAGPSAPYGGRLSSASSGYDNVSRNGSPRPQERHNTAGNVRLSSRAKATRAGALASPGPRPLPSQRVEFSYTNPAMSTLAQAHSPDHDEIAGIIADMTKTRISVSDNDEDSNDRPKPAMHVFLQLGDDTKRALLEDPSPTSLVNLFIEKYQGRLDDNPEVLPSIYIKDPKANVLYELDDMADVVDGVVLSWHTRPIAVETKAEPDAKNEEMVLTQQNVEGLSTIVSTLAETMTQLPVHLRDELAAAVKHMQDHTKEAIDAMSAKVQASLATHHEKQQQERSLALDTMDTMDVDKPSITRSASMPLVDDGVANDVEGLRQRLQQAELELAISRQQYREAVTTGDEEKAKITAELEKLRKDVASHPNILRVRIEEGKQMLKSSYREHNTSFEDVHSMVQEMRKDVAQRGSIPSPQMMKKAGSQLKHIESGVNELVAFINDTRSDWKRTWEEELQNILGEQSFVKDVEQLLGELQDDTRHLDDVLDKLDKIIELKLAERAKDDYVPPAATKYIDVVAADDVHDAKKDFLKQIACVDVDHQRRLDALGAAERLRLQELAAKVNEFDEELSDFVGQRKLRKTGGTEELERRRAEKDVEVMKEMLKSVEEAEQARRAKIAQRKAAKKQQPKPPTSSKKVTPPSSSSPPPPPPPDSKESPTDE